MDSIPDVTDLTLGGEVQLAASGVILVEEYPAKDVVDVFWWVWNWCRAFFLTLELPHQDKDYHHH